MLKEVKIEITNFCYRNCIHCSSDATCDNERHLYLESSLVKEIIDQAYDMKASSIVFTGGEATLHPDLVEIVKYAKNLGLKTKLYSMCFRTDENIKLLITLNDNGLDEIIYSTATPLVASEDLSTYAIEEFIELLTKSSKLKIGFHHVVTDKTIDCINSLPKYLDAASDNLGKMGFLRYVPHGRGNNELLPSRDKLNKFREYLITLQERYEDHIKIGSPFNLLNVSHTPCNAADETMIIGFDGRVYPCDAMKYFDYFGLGGNVNEQRLDGIYNSQYFQEIRTYKNSHGEACLKCQNYDICRGGCLGQKMICATSLNGNKTMEWYEVNAKRTMNCFSTPEEMRMNAKMGLAGETGELIDCIKKLLTHNCSENQNESIKRLMTDEIGDIVWYIASSLSSYYNISFNEIGGSILHEHKPKVKIVNQAMIKYCALQKDPECPYQTRDNSYKISQLDNIIKEKNTHIDLSQYWEELDVVSFQLRRSDNREEIIKLASNLIIILGQICQGFLNTTFEEVLTANILRLQERYPTGFNQQQASNRIELEEIYKTDRMEGSLYIKK